MKLGFAQQCRRRWECRGRIKLFTWCRPSVKHINKTISGIIVVGERMLLGMQDFDFVQTLPKFAQIIG